MIAAYKPTTGTGTSSTTSNQTGATNSTADEAQATSYDILIQILFGSLNPSDIYDVPDIPQPEDPYRLILKEEPHAKRIYFEIRNEPP